MVRLVADFNQIVAFNALDFSREFVSHFSRSYLQELDDYHNQTGSIEPDIDSTLPVTQLSQYVLCNNERQALLDSEMSNHEACSTDFQITKGDRLDTWGDLLTKGWTQDVIKRILCDVTTYRNWKSSGPHMNTHRFQRLHIRIDEPDSGLNSISDIINGELNLRLDDVGIILDWDDTLFPTQWVNLVRIAMQKVIEPESVDNSGECIEERFYPIKRWSQKDRIVLRLVEREAIKLVNQCANLSSNIIIVTNASRKWIENCCALYYDRLFKTLVSHNVKFISARDKYKNIKLANAPTDDFLLGAYWKTSIVYDIVRTFKEKNHNLQVVCSIGDSDCERAAILSCIRTANSYALFKSIKFRLTPLQPYLANQLALTTSNLEQIICMCSHLDIILA